MKHLTIIILVLFCSLNARTNESTAEIEPEEKKETLRQWAKKVTDWTYKHHIYVKEKRRGKKALQAYIKRFDYLAVMEYEKYGVLPSVKLAQGILESGFGRSRLAKKHNAHFGKKGPGVMMDTKESYDGKTLVPARASFKTYKTAWDSWRDHSRLLSKKRYKPVIEAENCWRAVEQLYACGYFTDPKGVYKLKLIIKKYKLWKYDKLKRY